MDCLSTQVACRFFEEILVKKKNKKWPRWCRFGCSKLFLDKIAWHLTLLPFSMSVLTEWVNMQGLFHERDSVSTLTFHALTAPAVQDSQGYMY